jgi:hypothetical protein
MDGAEHTSPGLEASKIRLSQSPLAPWHLGTLAPWHLGTLAPWHLGTLAPWHLGTLALWHQADEGSGHVPTRRTAPMELAELCGWELRLAPSSGPKDQ